MRRIGLAVVLALSISAPFDIEAQQPSTGLPRPAYDRALWALRFWLDSWAGIGRVPCRHGAPGLRPSAHAVRRARVAD